MIAVLEIEHISGASSSANVRTALYSSENASLVYTQSSTVQSDFNMVHVPNVCNPARLPGTSWVTENPQQDWSDSPLNNPTMEYRHRFGFGRSSGIVIPPAHGDKLGNLNNNSGVLLSQKEYEVSSSVNIKCSKFHSCYNLTQTTFLEESEVLLCSLSEVSSEVDVSTFSFLLLASPKPYSIKNNFDTPIYLRLSNFAYTIDSNSITMEVNGSQVPALNIIPYVGGLGGFDVTWVNNYNFDYGSTVNVKVKFLDNDSPQNEIVITYPFYIVKDLSEPVIINFFPVNCSKENVVNTTMQFEVVDFESGVDLDSIVMYVNNILVVNGVTGVLTSIPRLDNKGYVISYKQNKPFLNGEEVTISIFVEDNSESKNKGLFNYSFYTTQSIAPGFNSIKPLVCETKVPVSTDVIADIIDAGDGLDKNTVSITVDDIDITGETIKVPVIKRKD